MLNGLGVWINATLDPEPDDLNWWELKVYYTHDELDALGLDESTLKIEFYNVSDDTWTTELDQGVNEDEDYVWVNLTHFSIFGLFGEENSVVQVHHHSTREEAAPIIPVPAPEQAAPLPEKPGIKEIIKKDSGAFLIVIISVLVIIAGIIGFKFLERKKLIPWEKEQPLHQNRQYHHLETSE